MIPPGDLLTGRMLVCFMLSLAVARRVQSVRVGRVAFLGAFGIAVLGLLGILYAEAKPGLPLESAWIRRLPIGLNDEFTIPALYSSALLFAAGGLALAASELCVRRRRWAFRGLALFFAFMGADEILSIHERLETVIGLGWTTLYAPVILAGGVGWFSALVHMRRLPVAPWCFAAGAAAWFLALVLEEFQYDDGVLLARKTILPEEILEMVGSLLFGLALLLTVQAWLRERSRLER